MPKEPAVYILSSKRNGTLYLLVRGYIDESVEGFTKNTVFTGWSIMSCTRYDFGNNQRETDQEMEPRMEA